MEVPLITRIYLTSSLVTTAACSLELVSPFSLYFNLRLVFVKAQARVATLSGPSHFLSSCWPGAFASQTPSEGKVLLQQRGAG